MAIEVLEFRGTAQTKLYRIVAGSDPTVTIAHHLHLRAPLAQLTDEETGAVVGADISFPDEHTAVVAFAQSPDRSHVLTLIG